MRYAILSDVHGNKPALDAVLNDAYRRRGLDGLIFLGDLAGYNAACRTVGGDYYDFITYADGRVAMLVGDVAGKGMPAALLMSSLQARVQVLFDDPTNLAALWAAYRQILSPG